MVGIPESYRQYVIHYPHTDGSMDYVTITAISRQAAERKFFEIMDLLPVDKSRMLKEGKSE